jgi:hypothetical protein
MWFRLAYTSFYSFKTFSSPKQLQKGITVTKSVLERVAAINNHLHQFYFEFETDKKVVTVLTELGNDTQKLKTGTIDESKKVFQMKVAMKTFFGNSQGNDEQDVNFKSSLNKLRDKMDKGKNKSDSENRNSKLISPEPGRINSDKGSRHHPADQNIIAVAPFIPSLAQFLSTSLNVNPEEPFKRPAEHIYHGSSLKPIDDVSFFESVSNFGGEGIDANMVDFYNNFDMGTMILPCRSRRHEPACLQTMDS